MTMMTRSSSEEIFGVERFFLLILSFFLNMYRDLEQHGRNFALPFGGENNHLLTN